MGQGTSSFTFYWVSATQLYVVNSDPGPYFSGLWQQVNAPVGGIGFKQIHFNGNVAYYSSGLADSQVAGDVLLATETANGATSVTAKNYLDAAGVWQDFNTTCTYSVVSNGRVTETGANCGAAPPIFYLNAINSAFVLGTDATVESGTLNRSRPRLRITPWREVISWEHRRLSASRHKRKWASSRSRAPAS